MKFREREREWPSCDEHANNEGKDRENGNPSCWDFGIGTSLHVGVVENENGKVFS